MREPQKTLILSHSLRLQVPFDTIQKPHIIIERHENALWKMVSFSGGCFYVSIFSSFLMLFMLAAVVCGLRSVQFTFLIFLNLVDG